jgi:hypothetical protein
MALVLDRLAWAEAVEPFACVVATAPVSAKAMTRVRMKSFMVFTPFWVTQNGPLLMFLWTLQMG